jgi:hypothetical protein
LNTTPRTKKPKKPSHKKYTIDETVAPMSSYPSPRAGTRTRRLWPLLVGIVLFASLLALRYEVSSVWERAAMAAGAFVVLGVGLLKSRQRRS